MTGRTFLDAGGCAPVRPAAAEAFAAALAEGWADPGRLHAESRRARILLDAAAQSLAADLGCRPQELRFSANHTTSLHRAVAAVARARRRVGGAVVASAVERHAVLAAAEHLGDGALRRVPVDHRGRVDLQAWAQHLAASDVALAALQHANGEVGTVQPLEAAHEASRRAGVPLLVDAGASTGHVALPQAWDLLAADPADWGAVPGVGVLAVRTGVRATPDVPEDEDRWFPGGALVPAVLAAAVALREAVADRDAADAARRALVRRIRSRVLAEVPDVVVVGGDEEPGGSLPHVLTFSCLYVDGEALLTELDRRGFAVGSGSACTSRTDVPSHVLAAMGALTHGNVRLALPRGTEPADVERFCDALPAAVAQVRAAVDTGPR